MRIKYSLLLLALLVTMSLTACGSSKDIVVPYKVGSLKEYTKEIDTSTIKPKYSDYQLMDIKNILGYDCGVIGNYIICNSNKDEIKLDKLTKSYKDMVVIYLKDIDKKDIVELTTKDNDLIISNIEDGKSVFITDINKLIPSIVEISDLLKSSVHKDVTLSSILGGLKDVSWTNVKG